MKWNIVHNLQVSYDSPIDNSMPSDLIGQIALIKFNTESCEM